MNDLSVSKHFEQEAKIVNFLPKNSRQDSLARAIKSKQLVFATGSAGTGKTYCTTVLACQLYKQGVIKKIVVGRPNVSTGPSLGAFPGEPEDKLAKWLAEIIDTIKETLGKGQYEYMLRKERIVLEPLETCRGRSYDEAFIIIDEAQNLTRSQLKMLSTRIGEGSILVFCGDTTQFDRLKGEEKPYLADYGDLLIKAGVECEHIKFTSDDIVRSGIVKAIVKAHENFNL